MGECFPLSISFASSLRLCFYGERRAGKVKIGGPKMEKSRFWVKRASSPQSAASGKIRSPGYWGEEDEESPKRATRDDVMMR